MVVLCLRLVLVGTVFATRHKHLKGYNDGEQVCQKSLHQIQLSDFELQSYEKEMTREKKLTQFSLIFTKAVTVKVTRQNAITSQKKF